MPKFVNYQPNRTTQAARSSRFGGDLGVSGDKTGGGGGGKDPPADNTKTIGLVVAGVVGLWLLRG